MKTFKILLLLCIAVFAINTMKAQSPAIKGVVTQNIGGIYLPCTGDYLWGDVTIEFVQTQKNGIWKLRNATVVGYLDAAGHIPSGNVYEYSQTFPGWDFLVNTAQFRLNGKLVAVFKFQMMTTVNANGDVTHDKFTFNFICK